MPDFRDHPLAKEFFSLDLPPEDYAIAGSGPLFARGWIADPGDIDVVARGRAWDIATAHAEPGPAPYGGVHRVSLFHGDVEILDGWFPERWPTDELIDGADVLAGVRFVQLSVIAATKRLLSRPRDLQHLAVMRRYGYPVDS